MTRSWTVTPDPGTFRRSVEVLAPTAEIAAIEWARGHDADSRPTVTVTAPGEPTQTFDLSSRVEWRAIPVRNP